MNFRQIKYFLATVQHMNITKAANALYVSQQALSEQIQKLEEELGKPLFIRTPRLRLTDAGNLLYERAQKLVEIEEGLINDLNDLDEQCCGNLTLGIGRTLGLKILPVVLPSFHSLYPKVKIIVKLGSSYELNQRLEEGTLDLLITSRQRINVESISLFEESFGLAVPATIMKEMFPEDTEMWVERFKQHLDISKFADAPFLIYNEKNHFYLRWLRDNGITPKVVLELNDTETLFRLAAKGMGVCFCSIRGREIPENMYCFPIDRSVLSEWIMIAKRPDTYMTNAMKAFINHTELCCKEVFSEQRPKRE